MAIAVGYHAAHVVNVFIVVVGRVLDGIVLKDLNNPSATIAIFSARFCFLAGILRPKASKERITN